MMTSLSNNQFTARCAIGLFQGLYIYLLVQLAEHHFFPGMAGAYFFVPQMLIAFIVPWLLIQGYGNIPTQTLSKWGLFATIILFVTGYYSVYRQIPNQTDLSAAMFFPFAELDITLIITFFIAQSLIISSAADQRFRAQYSTYFDLSWKLALQIIFTSVFTAIFWGLLTLGAGLFDVIHLKFFSDMIYASWFACPATALAIAVGLHVTDVSVRMVQGVRNMLLTLFSWLLPIITAIIALFLVCLVFMGLEPLWKTRYAGALLIATVIMFVFLINSTFQDGTKMATLHRFQQITTKVACCLLLPLMLLAMYALYLRVAQYGWSVYRINALCIMLILFSYSVGYFLAAFRSNDLALIESCNFATSLLILAMAFALFTPIADPARLMVNNQVARLKAGIVTPQKFDYISLRFKGLRYGEAALKDMQTAWQGPDANYIKTSAQDALTKKDHYYEYMTPKVSEDLKNDLILHTPNEHVPDSFVQQKWDAIYDQNTPSCLSYKSMKCDAWVMKDKQNQTMVIISDWSRFTAFQQNSAGKWEAVGFWNIPSRCNNKVSKGIKDNDVKMVDPEPQGQDMLVSGVRIPFVKAMSCQ